MLRPKKNYAKLRMKDLKVRIKDIKNKLGHVKKGKHLKNVKRNIKKPF